jgi:hypothetical protein
MRWLVGLLLFLGLVVFGGYVFVKGYPYRLYSNWVRGQKWNKYYTIDKYKPLYLKPVSIGEIPPYVEDYSQLWKTFPLRNAQVPLPVRHPLFQTIPMVHSYGPKTTPETGIVILSPNGREISRIYTLETNFSQDFSQGQDLFKLPFVRNRIFRLPQEKVWKDLFSHEIVPKSKSLDEMVYDLYILHVRSKILPPGTVKYGPLKEGKQALIELLSNDKDYSLELVMTYESGRIFSYVLRTEINNEESRKLRSKFLESISFAPADPAMSKFLYKEFKQLNFARQIDQEGMLYLFSAWSQDPQNMELFREIIFYLERGRNRGAQLKPLYAFALKHFGKTFTTKKVFTDGEDQELLLQRKIEIEAIEKKREVERAKEKPSVEPELTDEERMRLMLKRAKEVGPAENADMTIH